MLVEALDQIGRSPGVKPVGFKFLFVKRIKNTERVIEPRNIMRE